ncbi:Secreted protein [Streptomyces sp. 769]|nr:Secreted protein [Streptomyces sp. 769]
MTGNRLRQALQNALYGDATAFAGLAALIKEARDPAATPRVPADPPVRITDRGPADIMMIQNLRDPATPYFGTKKMRAALGRWARMVTVDHGGHGVYLANGNACGDRAVTVSLRDGRRPRQDVYCAG